ncbi:hypothetical protein BJX96DRAFT_169578 [Aspergillus floccosus]
MFQSARCIAVRVFPLPPKPTHHAGNCGLVSTYSDYPQLLLASLLEPSDSASEFCSRNPQASRQRAYPPVNVWAKPPTSDWECRKKSKGKETAPNRMPAKVGAAVCDHRLARIWIRSRDSSRPMRARRRKDYLYFICRLGLACAPHGDGPWLRWAGLA